MLQGTKKKMCEVGLFTVVKKASFDSSGVADITLRLVFDERVPNQLWKDPPWVALGGPGAFASIDLTSFEDEAGNNKAKLYTATGDIPNYFFCLGLPKWFAQWFVLPEVRIKDIAQIMEADGASDVLRQLLENADGNGEAFVGLRVPVMGWSWAVFLAQNLMLDTATEGEGSAALSQARLLIEGAQHQC